MRYKRLKYEVIIFDFDGVLVDSVDIKGRAFCKIYEQYGIDIVNQVYEYHMTNGGVSRKDKFSYYHSNFLNEPPSEDQLCSLCSKFSNIVSNMVIEAPWIAGAQEFLDTYYDKAKMYVASATPVDELRTIIKKRNMMKYFKGIFGSPRKKKDNVRKVIDEEGLNRSEYVMIGDSITDLDAASMNQIDFIGVGSSFKNVSTINNLCSLEKILMERKNEC